MRPETIWDRQWQNREDFVIFKAHISSQVFGLSEVHVPGFGSLPFYFPGGNEVIFSDVIAFPAEKTPTENYKYAREEAARHFWEDQLCQLLAERRGHRTRDALIDALIHILHHYAPKRLPNILSMELVRTTPGSIRRSHWCGTRGRILTLTDEERTRLFRKADK